MINSYFNKIDNIKDFNLDNGCYVSYKVINKEALMQRLEDIELSRKLPLAPQKVTKGNTFKNTLHITYLMVWTKVCGGSKIILEYANQLSKLGHSITIISYDQFPSWFPLDSTINFIQVPEKDFLEDYIPSCDVIVATSWKNIYSAIASKKAPVTFFEQGGSHVFAVPSLSNLKYSVVKNRIEAVPFIHTVSNYSREKINEFYKKDSEIVYNSIDSTIFYPSKVPKNKNRIVITIIGSENFKFKNIGESLEAIRQLKLKYPNIYLNWISQDEPKINKEKAIVNPQQSVIGDVLRETNIFICNSEYESFCLPVLEAMACGAAVVTTDNGGVRDFVFDNYNALLIEKHNINDLMQKVEYLIKNPSQMENLAYNGLLTSQKFSLKISVQRMEEYYRNIAQYQIIE